MSIAVVFPGQGSQSVGMGADLMANEQAKALFATADKALGYSLSSIMFEGPEDQLKLTQNTQPALLLHSVALWQMIADKVKPAYFAGHSLGEYSALVAAGGIDALDALKAVHNRGKFMQSAVPVGVGGMMAVLGSPNDVVETVCKEVNSADSVVEPANYNSDGQVVVAGHLAALEKFAPLMKDKGAKRVVPLPVSAPFHCSLMRPARVEMEKYLAGVKINTLATPVMNNVDAKLETAEQDVRSALIRQMDGAVRWSQSVQELVKLGVDTFIEVGAGAVLAGLVKKIDKNVTCINISSAADIAKL
ncbi:MAG: ACP S-malonyltransferase [Deferribacteraceae bacterium]|jgi:[acyl-carrier-protein] S-malonyltransferase|nr:ACP S-malonyltransferase [Deferribacteraceae bacterium]